MRPSLRSSSEGAKSVVNDNALTERGAAVLKAAFGDKAQRMREPGSASEDYSEFVMAGVPSFYFGIGGLDPAMLKKAAAEKISVPGNHSPEFAPVPVTVVAPRARICLCQAATWLFQTP